MNGAIIGQPLVRKDGIQKVTGTATYASDPILPRLAYARVVGSTIPAGRIETIEAEQALRTPGVVALLTWKNAMRLHAADEKESTGESSGQYGEHLLPLQDDRVYFYGQHVALVIAESLEAAEEGRRRVRLTYRQEPAVLEMEDPRAKVSSPATYSGKSKLQVSRGDLARGLAAAAATVDRTYRTPHMNHNPLEPHASIGDWTAAGLVVHETTQWVVGLQKILAKATGLPEAKVHVMSPFVGGGFGCKGFVWPHSLLAVMASRHVGRPVKLVLARQEMFTVVGHRGPTRQRVVLGADTAGHLTALSHETLTHTSIKGTHLEACGLASAMLYACPNLKVTHRMARVNLGSPTPMRAPGEAPGTFALESAMDELAAQLQLDPIELRVRNHAAEDPEKELPWSNKHLLECYRRGAELFGWGLRTPAPRSMNQGGDWVGWGMATATYPANRRPAKASVSIDAGGRVRVRSATQDLGTGTYTTLAQVAAQELGVPVEQVTCEIGDSNLPEAGVSGGSSTSASVAPAVQAAARELRRRAAEARLGYPELARRSPHGVLAAEAGAKPSASGGEEGREKTSAHSFGAQFIEVRIDPLTRRIRVSRAVSVINAGRILNALTARSQIQGGVVWGIGMALMERTVIDSRDGSPVTRNLADYLVPANADVPDITVEFVGDPDLNFNSVGVRGIGEIGITGVTAAIANAVWHATGVRVRELPITLERLL